MSRADQIGRTVLQTIVASGLAERLIEGLIGALVGAITRRNRKPEPVPPPAAGPPATPTFGDDAIRPPEEVRPKKVASIRISVQFQYSRSRFPKEYTEDNKKGWIDDEREAAALRGEENIPWDSKFWVDVTPFDDRGVAFKSQDVTDAKLEWNSAIFVEVNGEVASLVGHGELDSIDADNKVMDDRGDYTLPGAKHTETRTKYAGFGLTAYTRSRGYWNQAQVFRDADGHTAKVWVELAGVRSNTLSFPVS